MRGLVLSYFELKETCMSKGRVCISKAEVEGEGLRLELLDNLSSDN